MPTDFEIFQSIYELNIDSQLAKQFRGVINDSGKAWSSTPMWARRNPERIDDFINAWSCDWSFSSGKIKIIDFVSLVVGPSFESLSYYERGVCAEKLKKLFGIAFEMIVSSAVNHSLWTVDQSLAAEKLINRRLDLVAGISLDWICTGGGSEDLQKIAQTMGNHAEQRAILLGPVAPLIGMGRYITQALHRQVA